MNLIQIVMAANSVFNARNDSLNVMGGLAAIGKASEASIARVLTEGVAGGTDYRKVVQQVYASNGAYVGRPLGQKAAAGKYTGTMAQVLRTVRTEMRHARSVASLEADRSFAMNGTTVYITWHHGGGGANPRDGHQQLDGETITMGEYFVSPDTGNRAEAPVQFDDPADDINCTCYTTSKYSLGEELDQVAQKVQDDGFDAWLASNF